MGQRQQVLAQCRPVALGDRERARRLAAVAQHGQLDLAGAEGLEVAIQNGQFSRTVARAGRTGGIPEQADTRRQDARGSRGAHRHAGQQIALPIMQPGDHVTAAGQRQAPLQLRRQIGAPPLPLRRVDTGLQREREWIHAHGHRLAGAACLQLHRHLLGLACEGHRQ